MIRLPVLRCAAEGCRERIRIPQKHLPNLVAAGWRCPRHRTEKETDR